MPELKTEREMTLNLVNYIEDRRELLKDAVPRGLKIERLFRLYLTEFRRVPDLAKCDFRSVYSALLTATGLGLEIGVLNNAWLVPFKRECVLLIGYDGLLSLVYRQGSVSTVVAKTVYKGDEYDVIEGTDPKITHRPFPEGDRSDDAIVAFYAIGFLKDGVKPPPHCWLWKSDVDRIRARSPSRNDGPWVTDYPAMGRKTALRQLCKYLPKSTDLARAIEIDEKGEIGKPQDLDASVDVDFEDTPKPAKRNGAGKQPSVEPEDEDQDSGAPEPADEDQETKDVAKTKQEPSTEALAPSQSKDGEPTRHDLFTEVKDRKGVVQRWVCDGCGWVCKSEDQLDGHISQKAVAVD